MGKTYFEQVPLEAAIRVAAEEIAHQKEAGAQQRGWKDIAEEVIREKDPEKMIQLVDELNNALEKRQLARSSFSAAPGNPSPESA